MPYLIDGHNLIPKLGLRLSALDDEAELVERLNQFCRLWRHGQLEIYFDKAQPGQPEKRRMGQIIVHFVRRPLIADEAIRLRLQKLKREARNWIVVSSDHQVQIQSRALGARVISSEDFARTVMDTLRAGPALREKDAPPDPEIDEWLSVFGEGKL